MGRMTEKKAEKPFAVSSHDIHLDSDYIQWIHSVKERFRNAQIKTAVKINYEQSYILTGRWGAIWRYGAWKKNGGAGLWNRSALI